MNEISIVLSLLNSIYIFLAKKTTVYYGQLRLPGMTYKDSLGSNTTDDYTTLAAEVTTKVRLK